MREVTEPGLHEILVNPAPGHEHKIGTIKKILGGMLTIRVTDEYLGLCDRIITADGMECGNLAVTSGTFRRCRECKV